MNPLTNVKNIQNLSKRELELGVSDKNSWHQQYQDSAWIFIGGLHYDISEGDVICVFSQYGEVVNINLIRDKKTGKSRGFCFLCYADQRSTNLAVDNLNGIKLIQRTIRVDHIEQYRVPKMREDMDPEYRSLALEGCAPKPIMPQSDEDELPLLPLPESSAPDKKLRKKKKKEKRRNKRKIDSSDNYSGSDRKNDDKSTKKLKKKDRARKRYVSDSSSSESSGSLGREHSRKNKHRSKVREKKARRSSSSEGCRGKVQKSKKKKRHHSHSRSSDEEGHLREKVKKQRTKDNRGLRGHDSREKPR